MNGTSYNNASMEATTFIIPEAVIKILVFSKSAFLPTYSSSIIIDNPPPLSYTSAIHFELVKNSKYLLSLDGSAVPAGSGRGCCPPLEMVGGAFPLWRA